MSVILVGLHCTVDIAMTGACYLLHVSFMLLTQLELLYCAVGIAMTAGIYYSLCMFSYRMPVKLTGGTTIGVNDTT